MTAAELDPPLVWELYSRHALLRRPGDPPRRRGRVITEYRCALWNATKIVIEVPDGPTHYHFWGLDDARRVSSTSEREFVELLRTRSNAGALGAARRTSAGSAGPTSSPVC